MQLDIFLIRMNKTNMTNVEEAKYLENYRSWPTTSLQSEKERIEFRLKKLTKSTSDMTCLALGWKQQNEIRFLTDLHELCIKVMHERL